MVVTRLAPDRRADRVGLACPKLRTYRERSIDELAVSIGTSIATNQEKTTRSIDQLTAGLERMTDEIAKFEAVEQNVLYKNSDPPPRPALAQVPKSVARPSQAPIAVTPAKNP